MSQEKNRKRTFHLPETQKGLIISKVTMIHNLELIVLKLVQCRLVPFTWLIHCNSVLELIKVDTVARDEVLSRDYRNKDSIVVIRVIHSQSQSGGEGDIQVCAL